MLCIELVLPFHLLENPDHIVASKPDNFFREIFPIELFKLVG
jgi:hypothetical protein